MKRLTRRARSLNALGANSNRGHAFGVDLPERDQDALLEYLKTL